MGRPGLDSAGGSDLWFKAHPREEPMNHSLVTVQRGAHRAPATRDHRIKSPRPASLKSLIFNMLWRVRFQPSPILARLKSTKSKPPSEPPPTVWTPRFRFLVFLGAVIQRCRTWHLSGTYLLIRSRVPRLHNDECTVRHCEEAEQHNHGPATSISASVLAPNGHYTTQRIRYEKSQRDLSVQQKISGGSGNPNEDSQADKC